MPLQALDHVNVRTHRLKEMIEWYSDILGMVSGPRPDFPFGGAWMYVEDHAVVHLVDVAQEPHAAEPKIEHFALRATDIDAFMAHLDAKNVAYTKDPVEGINLVQLNLEDCDGNHIHIDFKT